MKTVKLGILSAIIASVCCLETGRINYDITINHKMPQMWF